MRALAVLMAVTLLSGCSTLKFWESDEADELAPAELVDFEEQVEVRRVWSRGVVGGQDTRFASLQPALHEGRLFVADDDGTVAAVAADSGEVIWKEELDRDLSGGVGVGGGLVMVADLEGRVFALDSDNGEPRWRARVDSEVLSAPASNGEQVAVQTLNGYLVGLDAADGTEIWRHRVDLPTLTLRSASSPLITGTTVVAGFANGKAYALDTENGAVRWENRIALPSGRTELERMVDVAASPVLEKDVVYVTSYQGRAAAITRGTGRNLWYQDVSSYRQPAVGMNQVFITRTDDEVVALRTTSGQELWTNDQMTYRQLTAPVYADGHVAVGDAEGYLHVLSGTDGHLTGRIHVDGSGLSAPPLSDGETVFVQDNDGELVAYRFEQR